MRPSNLRVSRHIEPDGQFCEECHCLATDKEVNSYDDTDLWLCESCHSELLGEANAERNWEMEQMQTPY